MRSERNLQQPHCLELEQIYFKSNDGSLFISVPYARLGLGLDTQEMIMNKLAILLIAMGALSSGCVAYETPSRDSGVRYGDRDRYGEGVPNPRDSRLNDPRREMAAKQEYMRILGISEAQADAANPGGLEPWESFFKPIQSSDAPAGSFRVITPNGGQRDFYPYDGNLGSKPEFMSQADYNYLRSNLRNIRGRPYIPADVLNTIMTKYPGNYGNK